MRRGSPLVLDEAIGRVDILRLGLYSCILVINVYVKERGEGLHYFFSHKTVPCVRQSSRLVFCVFAAQACRQRRADLEQSVAT